MIYLTLFYEFFKVGLFSVGGGVATIPFYMELADKYDWLTTQMLTDMIAVSESTPGPIGINLATYAGFRAAGIPGALVATFSEVLPSFIILVIIAKALERYKENALVSSAFSGIRPAVAGLIAAAGWSVMRVALFTAPSGSSLFTTLLSCDIKWLVLFCALLALMQIKPLKKLHPIVYIVFSAVVGIGAGFLGFI
ncbi:MAG: chromate transporter [Eubacteriales bacterium]|nr:chromate transporter [Eubacteriales bacterium]